MLTRGVALAGAAAMVGVALIIPPVNAGNPDQAPQGSTARSPATDYDAVIDTLRREIPQMMADGHAVGLTITLVDGERTVWKHGFGFADRESGRPVTARTLFHIGSTSKTLTAAAVMQLVQRGKVDLDAPLSDYIPGFRLAPRFRDNVVTVRSILTHQSGIPGDVSNLAEFGKRPQPGMYDKVLRELRSLPPTRRVGAAWAYSNLGITLLQGVVENISGISFEKYTARHLFQRMGMPVTTFDDARAPDRRMAANYLVMPDTSPARVVRRPREYINIRPAGSVLSNATDMARYLKTMIAMGRTPDGGRILSADTVREMIAIQPGTPWDRSFFRMGLVSWRGYLDAWFGNVVNHGGDTYFHHSMMAWLPASHLGVYVSINTGNADVVGPVWRRALGLMVTTKTGRTQPDAPEPSPVTQADHAKMSAASGLYANSAGLLRVAVRGDALAVTSGAQDPGAEALEITPRADGWYTSRDETLSYLPSRIEGRRVLLQRKDGSVGLVAQAIPAGYRIPSAWRERVGVYRVRGISPNVLPMAPAPGPARASMQIVRGVLMIDNTVLQPLDRSSAQTFGPTPWQVMRDAGFVIEADAHAVLRTRGVRYVRRAP